MSLKERILELAKRDILGKWGRIILVDAPVLLNTSKEEITHVIREEIQPDREVRFHSDSLILIKQDVPIKPTTITWSIDEDTANPDIKPLSNEEIEKHMNAIYTPYIPPRRTEAQIEVTIPRPTPTEYEITQEDINAWVLKYEEAYPNKVNLDTIMNQIRRKLPTAKPKKIREMAQIAMRTVIDYRYDKDKQIR